MTDRPSVALLGAGNMGSAIARGLADAGWQDSQLTLLDSDPDKGGGLPGTFVSPPVPVAADVLVVAVKPQHLAEALAPFNPCPAAMVLSIAAGVTTGELEQRLGTVPVVRAMPNTPALIGEGMAAICAGSHAGPEHLRTARMILEAVGAVVEVQENLLDAVTAVSGSGPAYLFGLAEWLQAAAVAEGLDAATAETLVLQTLRGAALLLDGSPEDAAELRRRVTSPGGTTQAAFEVLTAADQASVWLRAVSAAADRSRELGETKDQS